LDEGSVRRVGWKFRESVAENGPERLKIIAQGQKSGYSCVMAGAPRRPSGGQSDQQGALCVNEDAQRGKLNVPLHYAGNFSTNANQSSE
jgi:hypothetical protein